MSIEPGILESHLEELATDYYDLQASLANHFQQPPTALEALRMTSKGHPTVIHGFSPMLAAGETDWRQPESYIKVQGETPLTIAVTDDGLADSVRTLADGTTSFVKPLDETMTMTAFLARLTGQDESRDEALYLQSQDGNIYRSEPGARGSPELATFQSVVARDVSWMKEASGESAEAVNLWIGNSKSTTSFHHDPYENIYHVLSGSKTFTLLSPIDGLWFEQQFHAPSTLVRTADGKLEPQLDEPPAHPVPWVEDLDAPPQSRPVTVVLQEGETLYLPAGWWHKVEQSEGSTGLAVAVNYWYASEINPQRYALERLAQRVARTAGRDVLPVDIVDEDVWGSEVDSADEWDPKDWGR